MFKVLALAAVAAASPVGTSKNVTSNSINKTANIAAHTVERAAHIEMEAQKKGLMAMSKYAKLAVLQGQYQDYKFMKHVFKRLHTTMRWAGPQKGCKAGVFARCVAQQSANKTRLEGSELDFSHAAKMYPQCTAKSGCAAEITRLTPAQKSKLQALSQKSDKYLQGLMRNGTRTQERLARGLSNQMERLNKQYMAKHQKNFVNGTAKILTNFGCNKTCFMDTAQRTNNLENSWNRCGCQAPVDIKFSPEEVLQMMSEHNMDVNAGIEEEDVEFADMPTRQAYPAPATATSSLGWMAFGALVIVNVAYIGVMMN